MTFPLLSYPKYKRSSCPWSRTIPSHWDEVNLWTISKLRNEQNPGDLPLLSVFLHQGVIPHKDSNGQTHAPSLDLSHYQIVRKGDFVLNNQQAWRGSVGVSKYDGIISPAYIVLNLSQKLNPLFADYLFQSEHLVSQYVIASKGVGDIQRQIYWPYLRYIKVPLPPLEEQNAIVRYLNHMDNLIKRYIRAKQKEIRLLEEKKQAIIQQAVTRGLDPSIKLKPSGIEWLGNIPAHWSINRLKHLVQGKLKYGANVAGQYTTPEWPRYLRITDFDINGELRKNTFRSLPPELAKDYLVKEGDILFARSGATVGKAFIVPVDGESSCFAGYLIQARPNKEKIIPHFLFAFLQSRSFCVWKDSTYIISTIQNIGADRYSGLFVPLPPLDEQEEICLFINTSTEIISKNISRLSEEIELWNDYRIHLISNIVTGQIDIRHQVAHLIDVNVEFEPEEEEISEEETYGGCEEDSEEG